MVEAFVSMGLGFMAAKKSNRVLFQDPSIMAVLTPSAVGMPDKNSRMAIVRRGDTTVAKPHVPD